MKLYSQEDIFVIAIRRSGNHAMANWLIPHYDGFVRYLNDYTFREQMQPQTTRLEGNPTFLYLTAQGQTFCVMNKGQVWTLQEIIARECVQHLNNRVPRLIKACYNIKNFERLINEMSILSTTSQLPYWVDDDVNIEATVNLFGCENQTPANLQHVFAEWEQAAYQKITTQHQLEMTRQRTFLLVLRNPFNNLASLMKNPSLWPPNHIPIEQFPETWMAYAKEYLGETTYLSQLGKVIFVNYDQWFADQTYRTTLSEQLNRPFTDRGLQKISLHGEGSSFDKFTYANRAQAMPVLERWKTLQHNAQYRSLLQHPELLALSERIYGPPPFDLSL